MKLRLPLLSLLALGVWAGLAVVAWEEVKSPEPALDSEALTTPTPRSRPGSAKSSWDARPTAPTPGRPPQTVASRSVVESGRPASPSEAARQAPPVPLILTEAELHARAARVEQTANRELQQLVGLLDLNEAQQDRVFAALVRRSPDWHPAMQPGGTALPGGTTVAPPISGPGPSPIEIADPLPGAQADRPLLDDIASELTPEQQEELANLELDRIAWWEEIIPKLLPPGDTPLLEVASGTEAPASNPDHGTAAAAPPPPAPATVKEGAGEIILD